MLYPLKFKPLLFHKIWGGSTIAQWYDHVPADYENVGEAWVMSDVEKYPTEVVNGQHAGDSLHDLLEVYMDELVGGTVFEIYGNHFPLLLKFIDAADDLSIQVHPNDDYALEHENSLGKNEMWYVLPSANKASIYLGWNKPMSETLIRAAIEDGSLAAHLRKYEVETGSTAYIPAGTVHAMRRDTIVAEIQENSDITYRLYDYNRVGHDGKKRPLKLDKALEVIDFENNEEIAVMSAQKLHNGVANLAEKTCFTTNILSFDRTIERDYAPLDSFVAYMCVEGECAVTALDSDVEEREVTMRMGEAVLVPATLCDIQLSPKGKCQLLEIYINLK